MRSTRSSHCMSWTWHHPSTSSAGSGMERICGCRGPRGAATHAFFLAPVNFQYIHAVPHSLRHQRLTHIGLDLEESDISRMRLEPAAQSLYITLCIWALKMTDMKMTDHRNVQAWNWRTWKWRTWKCRTRFRCLNRSDDTEHCRMHGIVSGTFDIGPISWYSYTWYFRWYFI